MSDGIYVALSGAVAQAAVLDATANNLANASTDGYQRVRPVFRDALAQATNNGAPMHAVTASTTALDTTRGALRVTGRDLDVALPDKSYLSVSTPRGERFTRAGALVVAPDGVLRTSRGDAVLAENGKPIRLPPEMGAVKLSPAGEVWQGDTLAARLRMVTFPNPEQLAPEGSALLNATPAAGTPTASKGQLTIGSIEESNTSVVGAMTDLVTAGRAFDAFQRAIDAFHEADQKITTTVPGDQ